MKKLIFLIGAFCLFSLNTFAFKQVFVNVKGGNPELSKIMNVEASLTKEYLEALAAAMKQKNVDGGNGIDYSNPKVPTYVMILNGKPAKFFNFLEEQVTFGVMIPPALANNKGFQRKLDKFFQENM